MDSKKAQEMLDKIVGQIFGYKNPFMLEQFMQKYAFDVQLPNKVQDAISGETTWTQSINSGKYLTLDNARKMGERDEFNLPKQPIESIEELLRVWDKTNYTTTERQIESINTVESDNIRQSENVYRSLFCTNSKNLLFCDGVARSEYVAASQRSSDSNYSIRIDDSNRCSGCFTVAWSAKVVNSMFINDCFDLQECLFCSHLASKKYWVANMPFEKEEYLKIKDMVIKWILTS